VADTDVPVIPEAYHVGIVWGAVATGLMLVDEDQQSAAGYEQKFEKVKAELTRRKNKRVGSGPVQIQIAGSTSKRAPPCWSIRGRTRSRPAWCATLRGT
jgi:hypothetical protein